ncbi:hypothetical protein NXS98_16055 [Fontisphaera persica]|uniref:hypothetical protein n=1 Tax=Fontisphaera persica TaxID=2974023 RepID=UPI0024C0A097|nr:hypothetical protein [Fontisphaera persica]WCJ59211.1 hypothetical protein NXS98_16055 [Fontisphaera persica]
MLGAQLLAQPAVRPVLRPASSQPQARGGVVWRIPGLDRPFLRYSASQSRVANCIGLMKGDGWEGLADLQKSLAMLRVNGRSQYRLYPREYFEVLDRLRRLWEEHGHAPDFFEKHYQPMAREGTAPLLKSGGGE